MGGTGPIVKTRQIIYDALPSQKDFHELTSRYKGFSGPVGSGKSMALCQEAIKLTYINPGRLGLLGAPTYPMLREATQATLLEILDTNDIPYEYSKAENTLMMRDTGSRIVFRPVDEFERLRGTNLAWFGLDELTYTMEEAWMRLEARLRDPKAEHLCGFAVWTPKGFDWVYRRFIGKKVPGYEVVLARAAENMHLLSKTPDFYTRLQDSYDESFYRQEVLGEYLSLSGGSVYTAFSRAVHATKNLTWRPERALLWSLDFNVDPMCSVVAQIEDGCALVLDEIWLRRATTADACAEFLRRYEKQRGRLKVYGDASGHSQQTTGYSDYEIIREHLRVNSTIDVELLAAKSNPPVKDRVNLTNRQLKSASGDIGLLVDPKCKELIADFEQVTYKNDTFEIDKNRDRMRTHMSDALGYLLWDNCRPGFEAGERSNRLL